jgi:hypothetical protein
MISAAEKRAALVTSQLDARSGLTNKERRALSNERNILRRWLFPDAETPLRRPGLLKSLTNLRKSMAKPRKPTKRRARQARRTYREQHTELQRRPDHTQKPVISMEQLERARRLRGIQEAKQAWFERKHGQKVNETACRDVTTEAGAVCAGTALVAG